jgi:hypothetical protein
MKGQPIIRILIVIAIWSFVAANAWSQGEVSPVVQIDLNGADLELMNQDVHKGMIVDRWILADVILPDQVKDVSWELYFGDNLQAAYQTTVKERQSKFIYRAYIALPVVKVEPINLTMQMELEGDYLQSYGLTSQMFTILEDQKMVRYGPLTSERPFDESIIIPINQRNDIYLKIIGEVSRLEEPAISKPETISPDEFEPAAR